MTIFFKNFTLDISSIIFGRALPLSSVYKDGKIKVIGLYLQKSTNSFSKSSKDRSEKLCNVATMPF